MLKGLVNLLLALCPTPASWKKYSVMLLWHIFEGFAMCWRSGAQHIWSCFCAAVFAPFSSLRFYLLPYLSVLQWFQMLLHSNCLCTWNGLQRDPLEIRSKVFSAAVVALLLGVIPEMLEVPPAVLPRELWIGLAAHTLYTSLMISALSCLSFI